MAGEPILVVEDHPTNLKLTLALLETNGYEVRSAASGEEALAVLASFRPRLILLDLQLPGIDGLELARRLKANPATRDIAIVALTAYAMKGDDEKARAAGCDGYITKPIDTRSFAGRVASFLTGNAKGGADDL